METHINETTIATCIRPIVSGTFFPDVVAASSLAVLAAERVVVTGNEPTCLRECTSRRGSM